MPAQQLGHASAVGAGRLNKGQVTYRQHHGTHQAGDARNLGDGNGDDHHLDARAQQCHQGDGQQDGGNRHDAVHQPHDDCIETAEITCQQANHGAADHRYQRHRQANQQRDSGAVNHAGIDIASQAVGTQPKLRGWAAQTVDWLKGDRITGNQRCQQGGQGDQGEQNPSHHNRGVAPNEIGQGVPGHGGVLAHQLYRIRGSRKL